MIDREYDELMLDIYRRVFEEINDYGHDVTEHFDREYYSILGVVTAVEIVEAVIGDKKEESERALKALIKKAEEVIPCEVENDE